MSAPTEQEIERVVAGTNDVENAADYGEAVTFEPELISGTRYKYVLTNAGNSQT